MPKRGRKKGQTGTRLLTEMERFEARLLIAEMLAQMETSQMIRRALQTRYTKLTDSQFQNLLGSVWQEWREEAGADKADRRRHYIRILVRLFRKAEEAKPPQLAECRRIVALMAKIEGMEQAPRELPLGPPKDDFANRSEAECLFYGDHGFWPEDEAVGGDPESTPQVH